MEFSSTDLTTILQESLKVQIHKNELENYASKIIIATSHRGQYKIRPCDLVNYAVEVHNKTIHFSLSLSLSLSLIHTRNHMRANTQACTHHHHCHCHCRQMDWSHLLTRSRSQNQRSRSLSDSFVRLTRIWVVRVREGISGSLWIRSVWKWQNKVLQMTTTSLISLLMH